MKYFIYDGIFWNITLVKKYIEIFHVSKQLFYAISDMYGDDL